MEVSQGRAILRLDLLRPERYTSSTLNDWGSYFLSNAHWLLPTLVPLLFLVLSMSFKAMFGQRDFHFIGGDMTLCGLSLYLGTLLRQIAFEKIAGGWLEAIYVVGILVLFAAWVFLLWLGKHKSRLWSGLSFVAGTFIFSLCGVATWHMLDTAKQ